MPYIANDILVWSSYTMVEQFVQTSLQAAVSPGQQYIPFSQVNLVYAGSSGAQLIIDVGPGQEIVTVEAVTSAAIQVTFANSHVSGANVSGATFPAGQSPMEGQNAFPLYTQAEMLDYLADAQKDFLTRVRSNMAIQDISTVIGQRWYPTPNQAARVERVGLQGNELFNTSLASLDTFQYLNDGTVAGTPTSWYQDASGNEYFGLWPVPQSAGTIDAWYFDRGPDTLALNSQMSVPDHCAHFLKYRVLAKVFEKEGEQRDPQRAEICWMIYRLGVLMTIQHTLGLAAFLREKQKEFDPFVLEDRVAPWAKSGQAQTTHS